MKKLFFYMTVFLVSTLSAQVTCLQSFVESGTDDGPTVITITPADLTCNEPSPFISLKLVNAEFGNSNYCDSWYEFSLDIDGANIIEQGCPADFNDVVIPSDFDQVVITSADTDNFSDAITLSIDVEVTFIPTVPPLCNAVLTSPEPNEPNAATDGVLTWSPATGGVEGYYLTVGTTAGGNDILDNEDIGNVTTYSIGELTQVGDYYVTITPYNEIGLGEDCIEYTFGIDIPSCADDLFFEEGFFANLIPLDGVQNAPMDLVLAWSEVNAVQGYNLTIGTTPGGDDVFPNTDLTLFPDAQVSATSDVGQVTSFALTTFLGQDLYESTMYYVSVVPFNAIGSAEGCTDFSFKTATPLKTDVETYTPEELIADIFVQNSECATVSNVQFSSPTYSDDSPGFGYFSFDGHSNDGFPFAEGIILSSGSAASVQGPFSGGVISNSAYSPGDADLENILGYPNNTTNDATYIQFDFVPVTEYLYFNFIMASSEYNGPGSSFQCSFEDAFAFILTDQDGNSTNLAVLPETDTDTNVVSVTNIHPEVEYSCDAANEQFFDSYAVPGDPSRFPGRTVQLQASTAVVPGQLYTIKLVVADQGDSAYDTGIFLEAGSFSIGDVDLGDDIFLGDEEALCEGDTHTLNAGTLLPGTSLTWYADEVEVEGSQITNEEGELEEILVVDQTAVYKAEIRYGDSDCTYSQEVTIQFYPNPAPDLGGDKLTCATEELVLDANLPNSDGQEFQFVWSYNGIVIEGETGSTFTIGETEVVASDNLALGTVMYVDPITNQVVYSDIVDGVYPLAQVSVAVSNNDTGCTIIDTVQVSFYENANCVTIPTGISPNGDGLNDCLVIDDLALNSGVSKIFVYNRYGDIVFEGSDYSREWCGESTSGEDLPVGTYYYVLEFKDGRDIIKGWVYINREIK